jgi:hypothetical protein
VSALGRPSARWRPADAPRSAPDPGGASVVPASAGDALRHIVLVVERTLRRPVSRAEIVLWMRAHPASPWCTALADIRMHVALPNVAATDERTLRGGDGGTREHRLPPRAGGVPRSNGHDDLPARPLHLKRLRPDRARSGHATVRYSTYPDLHPDARVACALEDAVAGLNPAAELEEINVLRRRASRLGVDALSALAAVRELALDRALCEASGVATLPELEPLTERLLAGYHWLETWRRDAVGSRHELVDRARQLTHLREGMEACRRRARRELVVAAGAAVGCSREAGDGDWRAPRVVGDAPIDVRP